MRPMQRDQLDRLLDLCEKGIDELLVHQDQALGVNT